MPLRPRPAIAESPSLKRPSAERIALLLKPYLGDFTPPADLFASLSVYLDLLLRWNARTNLTAIREPEEMVRRHFGESLFAGLQLHARLATPAERAPDPPSALTINPAPSVLDFGSGAGFPGLPIQLLHPGWRVTLAESQGKKAAFLREAARTLGLETEVWAGRVEDLPPFAGRLRQFDAVTLRAVDKMEQALREARRRVLSGGWLVIFTTQPSTGAEALPLPEQAPGWLTLKRIEPAAALLDRVP
jgi:16S rRNA (guanine527-N7)-methyltransferase